MIDRYADVPTRLGPAPPVTAPPPTIAVPTVLPRECEVTLAEPEPRAPRLEQSPASNVVITVSAGLITVGIGLLALMILAAESWQWSRWLVSVHPVLPYVFWVAAGAILAGVLGHLRLTPYFRLRAVDRLKDLIEQADSTRELLAGQERELHTQLERYTRSLRRSGSITGGTSKQIGEQSSSQEMMKSLRTLVLPDLDREARRTIEGHARAVAISTALSPSGTIDSALVLWRNSQMIAEIASCYGLRPGRWGIAVLTYRVILNVATAAVSQESINMLSLAYGPKLAEAIGKTMGGVGGAIAAAGGVIATANPLVGVPVAFVGGLVRTVSVGAGQAAEVVSGPVLQGILTAILTVRTGLEVQRQCRVVPMTEEERADQTASLVGALRTWISQSAGDSHGEKDE
jgi:putative membrane protein